MPLYHRLTEVTYAIISPTRRSNDTHIMDPCQPAKSSRSGPKLGSIGQRPSVDDSNRRPCKNRPAGTGILVKKSTSQMFYREHDRSKSPGIALRNMAQKWGLQVLEEAFSDRLDRKDPLAHFRNLFNVPLIRDLPTWNNSELVDGNESCVYMIGNSLGLRPLRTKPYVDKVLDQWSNWGIGTHFHGFLPAAECDEFLKEGHARLVGAELHEVTPMNTLTVNLHLLMVAFYKPIPVRYKIVIEAHAFPSDRYAVISQTRYHGYDADISIVELAPRPGEQLLRTEDIIDYLNNNGHEVCLVLLGGVQYHTGQAFDIQTITEAGHRNGCVMGWDLAHAAGNIRLHLHDWDVDFAAWCSYKYLNSGPGGIGAVFIHEKHHQSGIVKFEGWWGNKESTRFDMLQKIDVCPGPDGFRLSNPSPVLMAMSLASIEIFDQLTPDDLLEKQYFLTGYLELLIDELLAEDVEIVTPRDPIQRGSQLSLILLKEGLDVQQIQETMDERGVVCDIRKPGVMRVAPVPLYNTFRDVYRFVQTLRHVLLSFGGKENGLASASEEPNCSV